MKAKILLLALGIILLFTAMGGCLGQHKTCPECEGSGREIWTLYLTECEDCGGDGEVGLFMDDEDAEDAMSGCLVVVIIVAIVVVVIIGASKKTPPSQQPQQYQQPYQRTGKWQQYQPPQQQQPPPPGYQPPQQPY